MESIQKLKLVQTSSACPEQYEVYLGENNIGYMRLRHGYFRAEYLGKIVFEGSPNGDGIFTEEERPHFLNKACREILTAHFQKDIELLYEIT